MTSARVLRSAGRVALLLVAFTTANVILAACGGAGVTTAGAPSATPALAGAGATPGSTAPGTILFTKGTLSGPLIETSGIFTVRSDGTGLTPLAKGPWLRSPAWSPDGSRIAYIDSYAVRVMNADGSGKRSVKVASNVDDRPDWLTWSSDGTKIIFTNHTADGCDLYAMNADGSGRRLLVHGKAGTDLGRPACAPRGRVFFGRQDGEVCSVNPDGSGLALVRRTPPSSSFSLSPDGTWLLLWSGDGLERLPASGAPGKSQPVLDSVSRRAGARSFFALASSWSPDGERIAFAADQTAWIAPTYLCVMDADGSHVRRIPRAGLGWNPVWRPE